MKKRLFCVLLGLLVGFSLPLSAMAIGGPIFTEPIEDLIPGVNLVQTTAPQGAVAVGYNLLSEETIYYRVNGATLDLPNGYPYHNEPFGTDMLSPDAVIDDGLGPTQVGNTEMMPYSAIAYIDILYANGERYAGTAFMISPNVAMTAAHNLFEQECTHHSENWAISVAVYPGTKNGYVPYGAGYAEEVVISAPYYTESKIFKEGLTEGGSFVCACDEETTLSDYYDWGFILLDEPIGYLSGYFDYQYNSQTTGTSVTFCAYRDTVSTGVDQLSDHKQFKQSGVVAEPYYSILDQTYIMHYTMDAIDEQSGGPIYYYHSQSGEYRVLAVHSLGYTDPITGEGEINQGCRITSQLYSFILAYTSLYLEPNPWE